MNDEILLSIRNQLLINLAMSLRRDARPSDAPADLEESGHTDIDGNPIMQLTYKAAMRVAVREHVEGGKLIQSILDELSPSG